MGDNLGNTALVTGLNIRSYPWYKCSLVLTMLWHMAKWKWLRLLLVTVNYYRTGGHMRVTYSHVILLNHMLRIFDNRSSWQSDIYYIPCVSFHVSHTLCTHLTYTSCLLQQAFTKCYPCYDPLYCISYLKRLNVYRPRITERACLLRCVMFWICNYT